MHITLYRHAQSTANAGEATIDHRRIPLTALGERQAQLAARHAVEQSMLGDVPRPPTLIVTSPFSRTADTAAFLHVYYPEVPREEWAIQEFTYLSPDRHPGTTRHDRALHAAAFWDRNDPQYRQDGAESLQDLFDRVHGMVKRLKGVDFDSCEPHNVVVFSHGMFMRALAWCLLTTTFTATPDIMVAFRSFCFAMQIPNTAALPLLYTGTSWYIGSLDVSHLPRECLTT